MGLISMNNFISLPAETGLNHWVVFMQGGYVSVKRTRDVLLMSLVLKIHSIDDYNGDEVI